MNQVSARHEDRQWDCRINVATDDYLESITTNIMQEHASGKFAYILIGGLEIGTRPQHDDYKIRHVHICAIFNNRVSKSSILTNWGIIEGHGYYLVPRNRDLPYSGWRTHHTKAFSKIDETKTVIFEAGELPLDGGKRKYTERSEAEKKGKVDDIIIKIAALIEEGKDDEAFRLYPRNYLIYGERLQSRKKQKLNYIGDASNPHIWLYGLPGTGKTQLFQFIYPNIYKKDLCNKFFDLFDPKIHTHVILEDLDHQTVDKLGIQFVKTICDEAGFPIDQKYKTPQLVRTTCLVTSNFNIDEVVPEGKGVDSTKMALHRRFMHMRIDQLLILLGLKLIPQWELKRLKQQGNEDSASLWRMWDYCRGMPSGEPLEKPEYFQELIREIFYKR